MWCSWVFTTYLSSVLVVECPISLARCGVYSSERLDAVPSTILKTLHGARIGGGMTVKKQSSGPSISIL
jgi:hypothetical protein